jgi:twitching motility protein PilT
MGTMDIRRLLRAAVQFKASDLHVQVGSPPSLRIHGDITPLDRPAVAADEVETLVRQLASDSILQELETQRSADFAYLDPELARFRVNIFYESGRLCLALRQIPLEVPQLESLRLPEVIADIAETERGLVLVTGTTGSGKSTTLAAVIDHLNRNRRLRIITIEDPIEFVHTSKKSLIAQREVGSDTPSFAASLRRVLRQDPDFILVGELRDAETMRVALQAADTGHLVFSTMHTTNAALTVQRLIATFPPDERETLVMQLASNLEAVICQRLAKTREGGRIPVVEIMRSSPVIRKAILEGRTTSLPQAIANREMGMQLFDQHLADLYNENIVSGTEALRLATNVEAMAAAMRGISRGETSAGLVE